MGICWPQVKDYMLKEVCVDRDCVDAAAQVRNEGIYQIDGVLMVGGILIQLERLPNGLDPFSFQLNLPNLIPIQSAFRQIHKRPKTDCY